MAGVFLKSAILIRVKTDVVEPTIDICTCHIACRNLEEG